MRRGLILRNKRQAIFSDTEENGCWLLQIIDPRSEEERTQPVFKKSGQNLPVSLPMETLQNTEMLKPN
jgi:hypothetical protein